MLAMTMTTQRFLSHDDFCFVVGWSVVRILPASHTGNVRLRLRVRLEKSLDKVVWASDGARMMLKRFASLFGLNVCDPSQCLFSLSVLEM